MTVTRTNRFSLHRWDSGSDSFTRVQNDSDNLQIETLGAIFRTGVFASIGGASSSANIRSFYYATDQTTLYFSDGTNWVALNDFGENGDISTITPDATASAGTVSTSAGVKIGEIALADHVHAIVTATPSAVGTTLGEGSSSSFARADHIHELGTGSIDTANQFASGIVDNAALRSTAGTEAVNTNVIRDNAITTAKITTANVTAIKLASDVAGDGLASTSGVLSVNVDASTIEINTDTLRIKDLGVTTGKINDLAVTTGKINDLAVTTGKLNDGAVTNAKIANATIQAVKLASDVAGDGLTSTSGVLSVNVDTGTMFNTLDTIGVKALGVDTAQLAAGAVTSAKILDANVTGLKLAAAVAGAGLVQNVGGNLDVVGDATITVSANSIGIATGGVNTAQLADGAVGTLQIATNAVTASRILDGNITTTKILAGNVTAAKLASDVAGDGLTSTSGVLSVNIDTNTMQIVSDVVGVKASGIGANQIASGVVSSAKLAAGVYRNVTNADSGGQIRYGTGAAPAGSFTNGDLYFRYS